jgi:chromosome segregation ATPase
MSEEEKEAIEEVKRIIEEIEEIYHYDCDREDEKYLKIVLNYINEYEKRITFLREEIYGLNKKTKRLQKENEDMREELQMYVDTDVMILQKELKDSINARFELQRRIDKLQKENGALGRTLDDEIADNDRLQENNLSYQEELAKAWKENEELKEEIDNLIKENHKHIDYIADMKKKHEDKIRTKIKKLEELKADIHSEHSTYWYKNRIEVLKELLGDDE